MTAPADPVGPDEVERVAQAIHEEIYPGLPWELAGDVGRESRRKEARAAIAAIRSARETPGDADEHACGTGGRHRFGDPGCEYHNHHCEACHGKGLCTAHEYARGRQDERRDVVRWLRRWADVSASALADEIEAGQHIPAEGGGGKGEG